MRRFEVAGEVCSYQTACEICPNFPQWSAAFNPQRLGAIALAFQDDL